MSMSILHSDFHSPDDASTEQINAKEFSNNLMRSGRWKVFVVLWLALAAPAAFLHVSAIGLVDTPGATPVSAVHGLTAAVANPLGPWAGHIVRTVQFPNAGMRGFSLPAAIALTAIFGLLAVVGMRARRRAIRWTAAGLFALLMPIWYGYGFYLIADGML